MDRVVETRTAVSILLADPDNDVISIMIAVVVTCDACSYILS